MPAAGRGGGVSSTKLDLRDPKYCYILNSFI